MYAYIRDGSGEVFKIISRIYSTVCIVFIVFRVDSLRADMVSVGYKSSSKYNISS